MQSSLFELGGIPKVFKEQSAIFSESPILVRACMLELVDYLKRAATLDGPARRFVLYGEHGTGKSLTLMHALQYARESGHLIVHVPWGESP